MGVALAELSRALDAEDWSVAVTVSESALAKWPPLARAAQSKGTTGGLPRGVRERDVCAAPAAAASDGPPPDGRRRGSLPSARAERMPEHISRMGDVLPRDLQLSGARA